MEKLTNKKKARNDFFNRFRNLINIINIADYLTFPEKIKLGNLTSLVFKLFKKRLKTDQLGALNSTHLKRLTQETNNFAFIEEVYDKLNDEMKSNPLVDEYLANFTFQHIFSIVIRLNNNDETVITKLIKFFYAGFHNLNTVELFSITDCNFTNNNLNILLNSLLLNSRNLLDVTIINSNLKDSDLPIIINYLKKNNLKNLTLSNNKIGRGEEALELLSNLKHNESLEQVKLDNCLFNSKSINLIKEIYSSQNNKIQNITLYNNSFCLESCQLLFNDIKITNNKFVGLSFKWSPEYILNNRREVKFCDNLIINQYDLNEFYEIYLDNLNFDFLTISKLDMRLSFILDNIFKFNSSLLGLHANLDKMCFRSRDHLVNFIKEDKLDSLSLAFNEGIIEQPTNMTNLKLNDFFNVIKDLKNLKKLNLDEELETIGNALLQIEAKEETTKENPDKSKKLLKRKETCDTDFDNCASDQEEEL